MQESATETNTEITLKNKSLQIAEAFNAARAQVESVQLQTSEALQAGARCGQMLLDVKQEIKQRKIEGGFALFLDGCIGTHNQEMAKNMMKLASSKGTERQKILQLGVVPKRPQSDRKGGGLGITVGKPWLRSLNSLCGYVRELSNHGIDEADLNDFRELRELLDNLFAAEAKPPAKESI